MSSKYLMLNVLKVLFFFSLIFSSTLHAGQPLQASAKLEEAIEVSWTSLPGGAVQYRVQLPEGHEFITTDTKHRFVASDITNPGAIRVTGSDLFDIKRDARGNKLFDMSAEIESVEHIGERVVVRWNEQTIQRPVIGYSASFFGDRYRYLIRSNHRNFQRSGDTVALGTYVIETQPRYIHQVVFAEKTRLEGSHRYVSPLEVDLENRIFRAQNNTVPLWPRPGKTLTSHIKSSSLDERAAALIDSGYCATVSDLKHLLARQSTTQQELDAVAEDAKALTDIFKLDVLRWAVADKTQPNSLLAEVVDFNDHDSQSNLNPHLKRLHENMSGASDKLQQRAMSAITELEISSPKNLENPRLQDVFSDDLILCHLYMIGTGLESAVTRTVNQSISAFRERTEEDEIVGFDAVMEHLLQQREAEQ